MSEERIAKLEARVEHLERIITGLAAVFGGGGADGATDRELDSDKGDPDVRFSPRGWSGEPVAKGTKFSRCPADFLDALADAYDFFAQRNDAEGATSGGKPKSYWDRRSSKLARGWSRRIRAGWTPPPPPPRPNFGSASNGAAPNGTGFGSQSGNRFGGGSTFGKPATTPDPDPPMGDDDFNFGHNAAGTKAPEDHDDDPPL